MTVALGATPDVTVVTGGAGWFGTALLHAFTGDGQWGRAGEVRVLVERREDAARLAALGTDSTRVNPVVGDIRAADSVAALFDDLSGGVAVDVIHAAGVIHPVAPADFDSINAQGTEIITTEALAHRVRRFVHVSSNSPFGTNAGPDDVFTQCEPYRPYLGYGTSKMEAELAVLRAVEGGLNAVIVRPLWFYGPHQPARQTTFFQMVRTGRFPIFGDGRQRRSMTYVDHLVQGVCRAELVDTDPGLGWWVADERPYEVREIIATVGAALERAGYDVAPNRVRLPSFAGDAAERLDRVLQARGRYQQQIHVLGEMNKTIACDIGATRRDLGYEPEVSLAAGMDRSIAWCRQQGIDL